jgi:hypothetical protein
VTESARIEYRRHPRAKVYLPTQWGLTRDCLWAATITSLSIGGCFLLTERIKSAGTQVYVKFWFPEETSVRGEVRYYLEKVGIGVEFKGLPARPAQLLMDYVNDLLNIQEHKHKGEQT